MLQKKDVTFYDRFTYIEKPSKVKVTNENFYGGFAIEDPQTYDAFLMKVYINYFKKQFYKNKLFSLYNIKSTNKQKNKFIIKNHRYFHLVA